MKNQINLAVFVSANTAALCFAIGFSLYFAVFAESGYLELSQDLAPQIKFLLENQALIHAWYLIIYVLFGLSLAVLSLSLHQVLKVKSSCISSLAYSLAIIWTGLVVASGMIATVGNHHVIDLLSHNFSAAETLWLTVQVLVDGVGGGNEIMGGSWLILVNYMALKQRMWPKLIISLGMITGTSGILTALPNMQVFEALFGFGCIVWFGGLSVVFLNKRSQTY